MLGVRLYSSCLNHLVLCGPFGVADPLVDKHILPCLLWGKGWPRASPDLWGTWGLQTMLSDTHRGKAPLNRTSLTIMQNV